MKPSFVKVQIRLSSEVFHMWICISHEVKTCYYPHLKSWWTLCELYMLYMWTYGFTCKQLTSYVSFVFTCENVSWTCENSYFISEGSNELGVLRLWSLSANCSICFHLGFELSFFYLSVAPQSLCNSQKNPTDSLPIILLCTSQKRAIYTAFLVIS